MSFIRVFVFLKKFINIILLFSILYLTFMKRFYIREVICQAFHTNQSTHAKTICNKTISTVNLIITVLMCFLLYVIVFKTAAHLAFNTPLRNIFKLVVFFSFGFNAGFYIIMAGFSYFVYHAVMTYMYWNQYDEYMIKYHRWTQPSTAYSVLVWFVVIVVMCGYYNLVKRDF